MEDFFELDKKCSLCCQGRIIPLCSGQNVNQLKLYWHYECFYPTKVVPSITSNCLFWFNCVGNKKRTQLAFFATNCRPFFLLLPNNKEQIRISLLLLLLPLPDWDRRCTSWFIPPVPTEGSRFELRKCEKSQFNAKSNSVPFYGINLFRLHEEVGRPGRSTTTTQHRRTDGRSR